MDRNRKRSRISGRGNMPFAMAAVVLLLISSAYGAAIMSVKETEDRTDAIAEEVAAVPDALDYTERYIEAGIGRIINDISTDRYAGNLRDRMESFDPIFERWLSGSFPITEKGNTIRVIGHDIGIHVEYTGSPLYNEDGSRPSFLKAEGKVTVEFSNSAGTETRVLRISADGTSGIPFIVNAMTDFELSAEGDASILTQLMAYQLSSLAQTRVLNGFGALSEFGEKGTLSIITEQDVEESLENALAILESLCFRTADNGYDLIGNGRVDAAELLVSDDGSITMDLSTVMSQALVAAADQIVIKWADLVWGSEILDLADIGLDAVKSGIRKLQSLFSNEDLESAVPYIRDVMDSRGYGEDDYRYIGGNTVTFSFDAIEIDVPDWYGFTDPTYTLEAFSVDIVLPSTDMFGWDGWSGYIGNYDSGKNAIREIMRATINAVAIDCNSRLGTVKVVIDPYDDETFPEALARAFDDAFEKGISKIEGMAYDRMDTGNVPDPLYYSICGMIKEKRSEIYNMLFIESAMETQLRTGIEDHIRSEMGEILDPGTVTRLVDEAMSSADHDACWEILTSEVDEKVALFERAMSDVNKEINALLKEILKFALEKTLDFDMVRNNMDNMARLMLSDMTSFIEYDIHSGITEFDGEEGFLLLDGEDRLSEQFIEISDVLDVDVEVRHPRDNKDRCIHNVDVECFTMSPYTTVFTVDLTCRIDYSISSTTSVMAALGWYDCLADGSICIDTSFDVPCVSGWRLAGVEYTQSQHISEYLWKKFMDMVDPLMDPLKEVFKSLLKLYEIGAVAMIELNAYVEDILMRIYERLVAPVEKLQELIENGLLELISSISMTFDVGMGYQSFTFYYMDMTLTLETRLATLSSTTKSLCKITATKSYGDIDILASVEVKENKKNGLMFKGVGEISGDGWNVKAVLDPMMKFSKRMIYATGTVNDIDFSVSLPEIKQYDEIELRLSSIPAVGQVLSNIALPVPDLKASVDMGVFLKYDSPITAALVINEFESNPKGTDRGNEWAELYNGTLSTIDLSGYVLTPGSNESKSVVLDGLIRPMEKKVVQFESQVLNNSAGKKDGERLILYDPDGNEVDSTPWKTDNYNDDRTWQRSTDAGKTWEFTNGTKGKSNGSYLGADTITKYFVIDSLTESAEKALYEMGNHLQSVEDIEKFLKRMVSIFITTVIDKIADLIIAAGVFISVELTDYAETLHSGLKVSLEIDSDIVKDGIKWILSQIDFLSEYVKAPKCSDPTDILCDDTYLRTTYYTSASAPKILSKDTDIEVTMGYSAAVNLSTLFTLSGEEKGTWMAEAGLVIIDCPFELMPKKMNTANGNKGDLWLIKISLEKG